MYFFYNLALALAALATAPWWLFKLATSAKHRAGLRERLGRVPAGLAAEAAQGRPIWLHAVSVGEVLACAPLVAALRREFPETRVLISTTTATGQKVARERFGAENVFYFPLDFAFAVRAYVGVVRPQLAVLAEAEFWPNFLRIVKLSGANIAVVNARISDRSLAGYRRWRWWMKLVLGSVDLFLAQSEADAARLRQIGAAAERVRVSGNLKYELAPVRDQGLLNELRAALRADGAGSAAGPVLVAGSTLAGEEAELIQAFRQILAKRPRAVMVLAPRHPERFAEVAEMVRSCGLPYSLRSQARGEKQDERSLGGSVFLLDSMGELAALYALADVAFVGGSLVPAGGHNILEPARYGVPIVVGPHTENFREIVEAFTAARAMAVATRRELAATLLGLLEDPGERKRMGQAARQVLEANAGACARTIAELRKLVTPERGAPSQPAELVQAGRRP